MDLSLVQRVISDSQALGVCELNLTRLYYNEFCRRLHLIQLVHEVKGRLVPLPGKQKTSLEDWLGAMRCPSSIIPSVLTNWRFWDAKQLSIFSRSYLGSPWGTFCFLDPMNQDERFFSVVKELSLLCHERAEGVPVAQLGDPRNVTRLIAMLLPITEVEMLSKSGCPSLGRSQLVKWKICMRDGSILSTRHIASIEIKKGLAKYLSMVVLMHELAHCSLWMRTPGIPHAGGVLALEEVICNVVCITYIEKRLKYIESRPRLADLARSLRTHCRSSSPNWLRTFEDKGWKGLVNAFAEWGNPQHGAVRIDHPITPPPIKSKSHHLDSRAAIFFTSKHPITRK